MAAITERGGKFLARVRRKGYPCAAKTFTRKADAVVWARRVESDMEAGRWVDEALKVPTLKEAISEYSRVVAVKLKGAEDYAYRFDSIAALAWAQKPVNEVTARDIAQWRDALAKDRKPATVVRLLALLSAVLAWCMKERQWVDANPASMVRRPRVSDSRDRTLSDNELSYLMRAATAGRATWFAPALVVLTRSAMRRGELCALKRDDVDFDQAVARLHDTKNGSPRDVPLRPQALTALRTLDAAAAASGVKALIPVGAVGSVSTRFKYAVGRARSLYEAEQKASGEAIDPAFLADLRLHDCRHHAVTTWAGTGGIGLFELMTISGHKNPRMVSRYTHLKASTLAAKMAGLTGGQA